MPKKKKVVVEVDPAVAAEEERKKVLVKEGAALHAAIEFEEAEAATMQLSKFQLHRNWVTKNYVTLQMRVHTLPFSRALTKIASRNFRTN